MENRLKYMRKLKGITQVELAKLAGTAQSHIAMIERGDRGIDFDLAQRLARALGIKTYELLPLEEQPEQLTPEEKAVLDIFRKSKQANETTTADTASKAG